MRGALESALLGQPGEAPVARDGGKPEGDKAVGEHGRDRGAAIEALASDTMIGCDQSLLSIQRVNRMEKVCRPFSY